MFIMEPKSFFFVAGGGDERCSRAFDGDSLLLGGAEGDLLRLAVGKTLPPQMKSIAGVTGEIHPFSIRRPGHVGAARRPHLPSPIHASCRDYSAWLPAVVIHFRQQDIAAVRGERRA